MGAEIRGWVSISGLKKLKPEQRKFICEEFFERANNINREEDFKNEDEFLLIDETMNLGFSEKVINGMCDFFNQMSYGYTTDEYEEDVREDFWRDIDYDDNSIEMCINYFPHNEDDDDGVGSDYKHSLFYSLFEYIVKPLGLKMNGEASSKFCDCGGDGIGKLEVKNNKFTGKCKWLEEDFDEFEFDECEC